MRDRVGAPAETMAEPRLWLVAAFMFLVFGVFVLRLFQLQLVQGEELRQLSQRNSVRTVRLEAPRGEILDREGRVVASTRPAFDVEVIPSELRERERVLGALGQLLDRDPAQLSSTLGTPRGRARFQPVSLASDLPFDLLARVETHRYALPGVVTEVRPRREYPDGTALAQLLGTLGEIRADQLKKPEYVDYQQGEVIGQSGLESMLEPWLRGVAGGRNVIVNVAGREVERLDEVKPVSGRTAVLSIDLDLQRAAVDGFRIEPPKNAKQPPPSESVSGVTEKLGGLVALDPRTGDVLAMVSRPAYDANAFAGGVDAKTWRALMKNEWKPLQNRAIAGQYPPGSTYKAFVAAAALQEGLITPHTRIFCPGSFGYGRRSYRCWKRAGHGSVDVHLALVRSCDVFFYATGLKLGVDRIARYARGFGLGQLTRIGLVEEKPGLIPTAEWKKRRFKEPWLGGETVSISIGQGYNLTTPLQLAVSYGAIATGRVMRPRLLLRVEDREGKVVEETLPETLQDVPVSPENLGIVRKGLTGVVQEGGGTGGRARIGDIPVAGKTGTSQVIHLSHYDGVAEDRIPLKYRDHAWFACWAPADAPEIVVAVLAEHGGHGGSAAAPIARKVLARYFEKQGRLPVRVATSELRPPPALVIAPGPAPAGGEDERVSPD